MNFWSLFAFQPNIMYIIIISLFGLFTLVGYFIIIKEIKVIKSYNVSKKEHFFSVIFGLIFSSAILLGLLIGMEYGSQSLSSFLKKPLAISLPRLTIITFLIIYSILAVYPLLEFIFLVCNVKEDSIFFYQDIFYRKVFSKVKNMQLIVRLLIAILAYILIFIVIPLLFNIAFPGSFFMVSIMLFQVFPIYTLSKLGAEGYFWGINLNYYNIMEKDKFLYTFMDDFKKTNKKIKENPIPPLALPIMIFVYINSYFSLYQMIGILTGNSNKSLGFTFLFSTIINILLALVGYYNKYWKKQIKYKLSEILLAGYLFAALAMNIFLNFYVKMPDILKTDFETAFGFSAGEISSNLVFSFFNPKIIAPVAMVQKVVFVIYVSYFFLSRSQFKTNVLDSIIMLARNRLNPIPLFNMIKHKNKVIKKKARENLMEMYRLHSIPYIPPPGSKNKRSILVKLIKSEKKRQAPFDIVFETLDSDHFEIRMLSLELLKFMLNDDPEKAIQLMNKHLTSKNLISVSLLLKTITFISKKEFVSKIDTNKMLEVMRCGDANVKIAGLDACSHLLEKGYKQEKFLNSLIEVIKEEIEYPNFTVQSKAMGLLEYFEISKIKFILSFKNLLQYFNHPNFEVKQKAILLLNNFQDEFLEKGQISKVLDLLNYKDPRIRHVAIECILDVVDNIDLKLPEDTIKKILDTRDEKYILDSLKLVIKIFQKNPEAYTPSMLFDNLMNLDIKTLINVIDFLEPVMIKNPTNAMPLLMKIFSQSKIEYKNIAKKYVVKLGVKDFNMVLKHILSIMEDPRFTVRNFTKEILQEIGSEIPDKVIPFIQEVLLSGSENKKDYGKIFLNLDEKINKKIFDETFRINAALVIGDFGEKFPEKIDVKSLINLLKNEKNWRVRRELAASFGKIIPNIKNFPINEFISLLSDENDKVKISILKSLISIANQ
ncbi:MAG: HEAT repeat domain-containing protein, partial [Promethearchaeota archaeon]